MAVRLLMPVLSATAVEAGLSSVLARLSGKERLRTRRTSASARCSITCKAMARALAAPVFDYKMIDGDYLLGPVASAWLVHDERARGGPPPSWPQPPGT